MRIRIPAYLICLLCAIFLSANSGAQAQQSIQLAPAGLVFNIESWTGPNTSHGTPISIGSLCEQMADWGPMSPVSLSAADFSSNALTNGPTSTPQNDLNGRGWIVGLVLQNIGLETYSLISASRDGQSIDPSYLISRLLIKNDIIHVVDYLEFGSYSISLSGYSPSFGQTYRNSPDWNLSFSAGNEGLRFMDIGQDGFLLPDPEEGLFKGTGIVTTFAFPVGANVFSSPARVTRNGLDVTGSIRNSILFLSGGPFSAPLRSSGFGFVVATALPEGSYEVQVDVSSDCRTLTPEPPVLRFLVQAGAQSPTTASLPEAPRQPPSFEAPGVVNQFSGSLISRVGAARVRVGESGVLKIHGQRLGSIRSATIGGNLAMMGPIIRDGSSEYRQVFFSGLGRTGTHALVLETSQGRLSVSRALIVTP